jgi:hypothetical protein
MKKLVTIVMAFALIAPAAASGQVNTQQPSVFNDYLNVKAPSSFLSIPGLSFSSSVGFSFMSGSYGSFGMGYYNGHFAYTLGSNLFLNADVAVGSLMTGANNYQRPEIFLPNIDLTYRPSSSFMLRLQFQQYRYPGYFGYYPGYFLRR